MTPELDALKATIEEALLRFLPHRSAIAPQLIEAMRHAALTGGKRLRPMLACAACSAFGGATHNALAPASAVEFVHAYSLVHDDLPAMDDDDLRRGAPSCHAKYGEATAILAGDALLTLAFEVLARADATSAEVRAAALGILAEACGWNGMVGGQAYDLASIGRTPDLKDLEAMHGAKTGALINASVHLGALFAGAGEDGMALANGYGDRIGLAFQIIDDVLDATADSAALGKSAGADARAGKPTFVSLLGVDEARRRANAFLDEALAMLAEAGLQGTLLTPLANLAVKRTC